MAVEQIEVEELKIWLQENKVCLIDVREEDEFRNARVEGAVLMPLSHFNPSNVPNTPLEIVFFCRSGGRSQRAAEIFAQKTGRTVYNAKGGILSWIEKGNACLRG